MLRLLSVLACLGALEAASMPSTATEPKTIYLPLQDIVANGQQYFVGDMVVGTPPQPMSVMVDVSDRLSYVPSVNCSDPFCLDHRSYDSSASSTYEEDGTRFEMPYGQNVSGVLSKDAVGLAGVTVQGQVFGEATDVWNTWSLKSPNDGMLGLGFGASKPARVASLLDNMADQGLIAERLVGLWLGRNSSGGELTLGGLNDDRRSGDLAWASTLLNPDGWVVLAESVSVGDQLLCSDDCFVTAATTSPYFFMSSEAAKAVNDALGGTDIGQPGVAALDCATLSQLPAFKMDIAGRVMEMTPLEYTFVLPLGGGAEMCISGFVGLPFVGNNTLSVGTLFMQKFYTAYDVENLRVGFADSV